MKARALLASLAAVALLATGCGSSGGGESSSGATATQQMSGMDMNMDMGSGRRPSQPARMICSDEIRDAVKRAFHLTTAPATTHTWERSSRTFGCTYAVPDGALRLSVQDALDPGTGRRHFDDLQGSLAGATRIRGLESFGLPSFETRGGDVVFLRDGKTLRVDATTLPATALPPGTRREDVAYTVAAAVVACWTE